MAEQEVKPCEFVSGACIHCGAIDREECEGWVCPPKRLWLDQFIDTSILDTHQLNPHRKWVSLTKEDKFEIAEKLGLISVEWLDLMQAIEAKLKDKNYG